ncbi:hypothetical protein I4U23_015680 [Adineta vaga]|nr:hypothetical protein I4U23_015680 [Adineta vaga]
MSNQAHHQQQQQQQLLQLQLATSQWLYSSCSQPITSTPRVTSNSQRLSTLKTSHWSKFRKVYSAKQENKPFCPGQATKMQADASTSAAKYSMITQPLSSTMNPFEIKTTSNLQVASSRNNSTTKSDTAENMDCSDCCGKICSECTGCCNTTCDPLCNAFCALCICLQCWNQ